MICCSTDKRLFRIVRTAVLLAAGLSVFPIVMPACPAFAVDVLIIGDIQYRPVAEVASGIKSSIKGSAKAMSASHVRGRLASIVEDEEARVVVALGKDALDEAMKLPMSVKVIYGLVIAPPKKQQQNMTGVYMSTPVSAYVNMVRKYLPSIKKISVLGTGSLLNTLDGTGRVNVSLHRVSNSADMVDMLNRLPDTNAFLLLPDVAVLSSSVMENVYLYSYRKSIPVLGVSEASVKQGSLFALVFDSADLSEQIAAMVSGALNGDDLRGMPAAPPRKFNLSLNVNTARKMGISLPKEMVNNAHKIYQ